jgi:hypothetical protein
LITFLFYRGCGREWVPPPQLSRAIAIVARDEEVKQRKTHEKLKGKESGKKQGGKGGKKKS